MYLAYLQYLSLSLLCAPLIVAGGSSQPTSQASRQATKKAKASETEFSTVSVMCVFSRVVCQFAAAAGTRFDNNENMNVILPCTIYTCSIHSTPYPPGCGGGGEFPETTGVQWLLLDNSCCCDSELFFAMSKTTTTAAHQRARKVRLFLKLSTRSG